MLDATTRLDRPLSASLGNELQLTSYIDRLALWTRIRQNSSASSYSMIPHLVSCNLRSCFLYGTYSRNSDQMCNLLRLLNKTWSWGSVHAPVVHIWTCALLPSLSACTTTMPGDSACLRSTENPLGPTNSLVSNIQLSVTSK